MSFIKNLQKNFSMVTNGYFANWTPDSPITTGDYGYIENYKFTKDGNITNHNDHIEIEESRNRRAIFERNHGLTMKKGGSAKGTIPHATITLDLRLTSEGDFYYKLKDLTASQFKDRRKAFETIGKMILSGDIKWIDDYVLITEVKKSGKTLIFVACGTNNKVESEISPNIPISDIVDGSGKIFFFISQKSITKYIDDGETTSLFKAVSFKGISPNDGSKIPLFGIIESIRDFFSGRLPRPEEINMRDYVEGDFSLEGNFSLPNNMSIKLCQDIENFESFAQKNKVYAYAVMSGKTS